MTPSVVDAAAARAALDAAFASRDAAASNALMIGLVVGVLFLAGAVLLGVAHSQVSVETHWQLGATEPGHTPIQPVPVTPPVVQSPRAAAPGWAA